MSARADFHLMAGLLERTPLAAQPLARARLARAASDVGLRREALGLVAAPTRLAPDRVLAAPQDEAAAFRRVEGLAQVGLVLERGRGAGAGGDWLEAAVAEAERLTTGWTGLLEVLAGLEPAPARERLAARAFDLLRAEPRAAWGPGRPRALARALRRLGLDRVAARWARDELARVEALFLDGPLELLAGLDPAFPRERDLAGALAAVRRLAPGVDAFAADALARAFARAPGAAPAFQAEAAALAADGHVAAASCLRLAALGVDARREVPGREGALRALLAGAAPPAGPGTGVAPPAGPGTGVAPPAGPGEALARMRLLVRLLLLVPCWLGSRDALDVLRAHVGLARSPGEGPHFASEVLAACAQAGARLDDPRATLAVAEAVLDAVEDLLARPEHADGTAPFLAEAAAAAVEAAGGACGRGAFGTFAGRADGLVAMLETASGGAALAEIEAYGSGGAALAEIGAYWGTRLLAATARAARVAGEGVRCREAVAAGTARLARANPLDVDGLLADFLPVVAPGPGEGPERPGRRDDLAALLDAVARAAPRRTGRSEAPWTPECTWDAISAALADALVAWYGDADRGGAA